MEFIAAMTLVSLTTLTILMAILHIINIKLDDEQSERITKIEPKSRNFGKN